MLLPVPIDNNFVPYTKRPVLRRNQDLFVDGGRGGGGVAPAASVSPACRIDSDCPPVVYLAVADKRRSRHARPLPSVTS
jgi:hypothetical protein